MSRATPPESVSSDEFTSDCDSVNGVGMSDPHMNSQVRRMLDVMNRLYNTGVQIDIDLPQIAVIGNQSAGKSSLIEAISGITLPRQSGTCTRCPTECRLMRSDAPWQCIVSLRLTVGADGQLLGQARTEKFGDTIIDKAQVEERIRRAQRAILNPRIPAQTFLTLPESDKKPDLDFSVNCITLHISGPDVADLSFCDLPGLIASVSSSRGGSDGAISIVENLVTSYIKKPSCIILLTVACETDFENQGAHRLVKVHDPQGIRTIGVLTKPDRIPLGDEPFWIPFIRNEKETLENNWFCVKQPSTFDLSEKITWAQARQSEVNFFASTAPWSDIGESYSKYLGTSNLVQRLTDILSELIATRVPQISKELQRSIEEIRGSIATLPSPPTSDPRSDILTLLHTFVQAASLQIQGVPDGVGSATKPGLIQAIRPEQEKFKRAIRVTAPCFVPFESTSITGRINAPFFLKEEEGEYYDTDRSGVVHSGKVREIYIDEVLRRAQQARTRELPGHYPFLVQKTFIDHTIKQWEAPSGALCQHVYAIISAHMKGLVTKHFAQFGQGRLEHRVQGIIQQHIKECLERAEERIKWLMRLEDAPFTLNTHYLADYREKFLAHYKDARDKQTQRQFPKPNVAAPALTLPLPFTFGPTATPGKPAAAAGASVGATVSPAVALCATVPSAPAFQATKLPAAAASIQRQDAVKKVLSGLAEMGMEGVTEGDLPKLLPADGMEPALAIMADVRAYFQVAYKRFADNVPLAVDVELVRGVERNLLPVLYSSLGINGANGDAICKEFAQENRKVADRRAELTHKLERLEAGELELLTEFA
ncbi:hypothetical protein HYPSUDRAFT_61585 [Hypholoma sublateritium FD-334 SS-4]|uniref:GED domain-containing protein n=1 Tax=Hypholoma sublateritium (strain FD-334 SS-4) TaxID=945553 RepID=A0A0D2MXF0_HYPSF|nr:hypothetical protein HYPSUDRAFT_61585 [Hypholoma sublateritium FD-334 SS-4]